MNRRAPVSLLVAGSLIVAGLCTVMVEQGWLAWIPVLLAIVVFSGMKQELKL